MSVNSQRPSWWRFPAPSVLVLVLLLSFLPWIEIGCESKVHTPNPLGVIVNRDVPSNGPATSIGGKTILASQSGFQIAHGGHTFGDSFADPRQGNVKGVTINGQAAPALPGGNPDSPRAAPLMYVFFVVVLAAVVTGFALPLSGVRILILGAGTGAALVVLLIQSLLLGFPAANEVAKNLKEIKATQSVVGPEIMSFFVRYTPWYWLTWAMLLGAFLPLVVEEVLQRRKRLITMPLS